MLPFKVTDAQGKQNSNARPDRAHGKPLCLARSHMLYFFEHF